MNLAEFDRIFIKEMHRWGVPTLRVTLGIVFLWFGALKLIGASPVANLIAETYSFLPADLFLAVLGYWEIAIGLGLLLNFALRTTLALLWLQMFGTLASPLFNPELFFQNGNIFLLTTEGEFVVKNLVLIAASLVIGGYGVRAM